MEKPFKIEVCRDEYGKVIGWKLSIENTNSILVWADQGVLAGFRVGDRFVEGLQERPYEYEECEVFGVEDSGTPLAKADIRLPKPEWETQEPILKSFFKRGR